MRDHRRRTACSHRRNHRRRTRRHAAERAQAPIRQLLTHTSGPRAATRLDHYRGAEAPLHELLCREPLEDAPGTHRYINRGYILLGLALPYLTGRRLDELANDLWDQIGMTSTRFGPVERGRLLRAVPRPAHPTPRTGAEDHLDLTVGSSSKTTRRCGRRVRGLSPLVVAVLRTVVDCLLVCRGAVR